MKMKNSGCWRFFNLSIGLSLLLTSAQAALPAGWTYTDIGAVGTAGQANEVGGLFTVQAAGSSIWGATDQFGFVYKPAANNCSIIAKVTEMQNTNNSARAGVMIRDNLNAAGGGNWVTINFMPTWGGRLFSQNPGDGSAQSTAQPPYWVKLERNGNIFTGYVSADGVNWGSPIGTRTVTMSANVYMGLIVCSYSPGVLNTSKFSNVATTGTVTPPGVENWVNQDIGATGVAGSMTQAAGVFTVKGGGADINMVDAFHYVSTPMSDNGRGNGSMTVRLTSQGATAVNQGKGVSGVMMRADTNPDSPYYYFGRNTANQLRSRYHRPNYTWAESPPSITCPPLPCWLKIERVGSTFSASYSINGTTWTTYHTITMAMPIEMRVGLMVCSGDITVLNTSTFDNVSTTGTNVLLPGWSAQDLGTVNPAGSSVQLYNHVYTVKGSGAGFAGNSDNGQFLYKPVTGDNQLVARVSSLSGATNTTAPAALMIRDSLTTASKNAVLSVSADKVVRFQSHLNAGDTTSTTVTVPGVNLPYWLKLVRVGNVLSGYYSSDGWNWQLAGSATVTLSANAYIGLAASSKTSGQTNTVVFDHVSQGPAVVPPATTPVLTDILSGLTLVDEINTATVAPVSESPAGTSTVATILGRSARIIPTTGPLGDVAGSFAYVIGANKNLVAGDAYVLTVEYPEDVSRSIYLTNRGADYSRGWVTGQAVGDARRQYTEPTVESLNYPLSGQWKTYKQYFHLMERFQGIKGPKGAQPGWRPYAPVNGFHVMISRMRKENDPRSAGAAVGWIRLYKVANPSALYAPIHYPPPSLPRRSVFWREEMADIAIGWPKNTTPTTVNPNDKAFTDTSDWYLQKMKMAKILAINTLGKDLLEFGYNQGFKSGDLNWYSEGQEPNVDLWNRVVQKAADEGMELLPYYEYTGSLGIFENGLGYQRRSHKLYDGIMITAGNSWQYDNISWTADRNADVTDPDTLIDAKRLMDRTVGDFAKQVRFTGIWFRTRSNCLPMGFAPSTVTRFKTENPGDSEVQTATQATLIASYEGNKSLYNKYVNWWFGKRKAFLIALRDYLITQYGQAEAQVLFTPWTGEPIVVPHAVTQPYGYIGVATDDTAWYTTYANTLPEGWAKYHWMPKAYSQLVSENLYGYALSEQLPINHPNSYNAEAFHAAPTADPANYTTVNNVAMTYPMGRLFTLENAALLNSFRCNTGLTMIRHYPLNEDNAGTVEPIPMGGLVGYSATESDMAGHHQMLQQARAVAQADPRNLGYLCASSFNTGFPEIMRRFNQAFLAVPALPSTRLTSASTNSNIVVRQITTTGFGTYYYVVNTSMNAETATVTLPSTGTVRELVKKTTLPSSTLSLTLDPAELRAYRVGP
jgi:regulation of enolase protein 1 (concanavalin A-like superfamily)